MNARVSLGSRLAAGLGLASVAMALFATAAAADMPKLRFTTAGQAAARAAVVKKADFAGAAGWTGGLKKPDLSDDNSICPGFDPKESDLVLIGSAMSDWKHANGDMVNTQANVFQTPAMVKLDWQRTMRPGLMSCLRSSFASGLGKKASILSFGSIAFPRVAPYLKEIRAVVAIKGSSRRMIIDFILFGRGRTEIFMSVTALSTEAASLQPVELHLVGAILSRMST